MRHSPHFYVVANVRKQIRDILFNLSGFFNARCINDSEVDVDMLTEEDWSDAYERDEQIRSFPLSTRLHRHFFIQKCHLSCLGNAISKCTSHLSKLLADVCLNRGQLSPPIS